MISNRLIALFSFLVLVWVTFLLYTSAEVLEAPLFKEPFFPAGTLITWIGFVALPAVFYFGDRSLVNPRSRMEHAFSYLFRGLLLLSLSYGLVCFYLAGNWSFNFGPTDGFRGSPAAGRIFWQWNTFLAGLPLLSFVLYRMLRFLLRTID